MSRLFGPDTDICVWFDLDHACMFIKSLSRQQVAFCKVILKKVYLLPLPASWKCIIVHGVYVPWVKCWCCST